MQLLNEWRYRRGFKLGTSTSNKSKNDAAQRGIRYHKRTYKALTQHFSDDADVELLIEPWFQEISGRVKERMCSPDSVIFLSSLGAAIVAEVKLNWNDGKDEKLINTYLPVVKSAFKLEHVWPVLITSNLRGCAQNPLLGLHAIEDCMSWQPGQPTPILLHL